jgi:hypothetical protein
MSGDDSSDSFSEIFSLAKSQAREALGIPVGSPVPTADLGDGSTMAEAVGVDPEVERDAGATASGDGSEPGSDVRPSSHRNLPSIFSAPIPLRLTWVCMQIESANINVSADEMGYQPGSSVKVATKEPGPGDETVDSEMKLGREPGASHT